MPVNNQGLHIGIYIPSYQLPEQQPPTAQFLASYAQEAERLQFDSIWVVDHLFVAPPSYRVAFLDPLTALTVAATATERIRLGTGIVVLPLRDPVLTARAFAALDVMTNGRVIFGAGVGWDEHEFAACQIDRASRGTRMDEMLDIILGMWEHDTFSYCGQHFTLDEVQLVPRPVQQPRPPVWIAAGSVPLGTSQHITQKKGYAPLRSLRRVARFGDTLMSAYRSVPDGDTTWLVRDRSLLDQLLEEEGRDPRSVSHAMQEHMYINPEGNAAQIRSVVERFTYKTFEEIAPYYLLGQPAEIIGKLRARIDAGIDEFAINFIDPDPNQLSLFAEQIRPFLSQ